MRYRLEDFGIDPLVGELDDGGRFELTLNDTASGRHRLSVDGVDLTDRLTEITIWLDDHRNRSVGATVELRR